MTKGKAEDPMQRAVDDALRSVEKIENQTSAGNGDSAPSEAAPAAPTEPVGPSAAEELAVAKDQLLRLAADFDNYRKRARREKEEYQKVANERLLRDVLPVADNLDRALAHAAADNPVVAGVRMVSKQLLDILAGYGVRPFDSLGKQFNPEMHEALSQAPAGDAQPGSVLEEIERGYTLHDRLLRPAKVVVAAAPQGATDEPGDRE
jgi:molecular chaperone GrpE